ncbi:MAG: molybdopterin-dependent oxidoreductase [Armatimonadetes bacterium]|nr:molybdopterin-dependent oxidoreductase [Armatimonadota bacterium]
MTSSRVGFWAGLLAGILSTIAMYFGWFTRGVPVVALALWERQLRVIPLEVFSFLIVRLKFAAKPAAFWGMLVGLVILQGVLGWLAARVASRPVSRGLVAWALFGAAIALPAIGPASAQLSARAAAEGAAVAPWIVPAAIAAYSLFFAVPFALLIWILSRRSNRPRAAGGMTRRELLSRGLVLSLTAVAGASAARIVAGAVAKVSAAAQSAFAKVMSLPPEITPNEQFYIVSKNPPGFDPVVDAGRWSLQVGGLVGRPIRLTYEEIKEMPSVEQFQTLECISNEVGGDLISNAKWRGVRLRDVLTRAGGVSPKAVKVAFRCADGYSESVPIADAIDPTTLLAYEMNGEALPTSHGFPLRLLIPGLFGMKNPKWITRIEIVDYDFQGYWQASGWSDEAVVKTTSKFVTTDRSHPFGEIGLGGVAYGGDRGIKEVEVSTDDGKTWQKAESKAALGQFTWVLWAAVWRPGKPGEYFLKVRARDALGIMQVAKPAPTLPDGASGYHTLRVRVRK